MNRAAALRIAPGIGVFFLFFALYAFVSLQLEKTGAFEQAREDTLFNADTTRVTYDLAKYRSGSHYRTGVHPAFVVMFNPIGNAVKLIVRWTSTAATLLLAFAGGACVFLAYLTFLAMNLKLRHAVMFSLILGASASHLVFSVVPETFIFTAAAIGAVMLAHFARPMNRWFGAAAGAAATGTLSAAFLPALFIYSAGTYRGRFSRTYFRRLVIYAALVLGTVATLAALQKLIYPSSTIFFLPSAYSETSSHAGVPGGFFDLAERVLDLGEAFLFTSFVAGPLDVAWKDGVPWLEVGGGFFNAFHVTGMLAMVAWLCILGWAVQSCLDEAYYRLPSVKGLAAGVMFFFALFMFYGDTIFLYSPLWTGMVVALAAFQFRRKDVRRRFALLFDTLVMAFFCLQIANNFLFMRKIFTVLDA